MARLPTWEEMQKNQGVPVEMSPLERRVDALERKVQTLMDMLMAATVTVHPAPKPDMEPKSMLCKED